jgi:hypothetical protein
MLADDRYVEVINNLTAFVCCHERESGAFMSRLHFIVSVQRVPVYDSLIRPLSSED